MDRTVEADSDVVEVGKRIRKVRKARGLTLRELADRAGISESFLSQVELGKANASIVSLKGITSVLGVSIADLFDPRSFGAPEIVRKEDRPRIQIGSNAHKYLLTPGPQRNLLVCLGEFQSAGSTGRDPYTHGDSEEFLMVLSGEVEVHVNGEVFSMKAGDCITYLSSMPHATHNLSDEPAEVLWVMSPPAI